MSDQEKIRIDKFLWAVRVFKTRTMASDECHKGRIIINNLPVKPSHTVTANEVITVKKLPVVYTYKVIEPTGNRVSAKLVEKFISDLTSEEEKNKLIISRSAGFGIRPRGYGRPTKKERRSIDRLNENNVDS